MNIPMFEEGGTMGNLGRASPVQHVMSSPLLISKPRINGLMVTLDRSRSSWMTSIKEACASVIILRSGRIVTRVAGKLRVALYH